MNTDTIGPMILLVLLLGVFSAGFGFFAMLRFVPRVGHRGNIDSYVMFGVAAVFAIGAVFIAAGLADAVLVP